MGRRDQRRAAAAQEEEEEDLEPILDLHDEDEDAEEEEEEDDAVDEEQDEEDDLEELVANLPLQLRQRILSSGAAADDGDEEEGEEEDGEEDGRWGRRKKVYWQGDTADLEIGQEFEDAEEEEAAAKDLLSQRLQRMQEQDFFDGADTDVMRAKSTAESFSLEALQLSDAIMETETIAKDVSGLTKEQKLALINDHSPELEQIVLELRRFAEELSERVVPLKDALRSLPQPVDDDLVALLEVKHELLLAYCTNLLFYLFLKAHGKSVRAHPVMKQLLRLRYAVEKTLALEQRLRPQIDRLLKSELSDSSALRPNLQALLGEDGDGDGKAGTDSSAEEGEEETEEVYRPPKLSAVYYDGEEAMGAKQQRRREQKQQKRLDRLQHSEMLQSMQEQFSSAPTELQSDGLTGDLRSGDLRRLREEEDERVRFEEERFMRTTLTKKEKAAIKRRAAAALRVDNFDDLGDALQLDQLLSSSAHSAAARPSADQPVASVDHAWAGDALSKAAAQLSSAPRRRAYEEVMEEDSDADATNVFDQLVETKQAFKKAKQERFAVAPRYGGEEEALEEGQRRGVSQDIMANRGLTPHRKKANKNPRVKKRLAYDKALVRRKGQVRDVQRGVGDFYAGELTGIKAQVSRSRKMG